MARSQSGMVSRPKSRRKPANSSNIVQFPNSSENASKILAQDNMVNQPINTDDLVYEQLVTIRSKMLAT